MPELNDIEKNWIDQFLGLINKRPSGLRLFIDNEGDGVVEVQSLPGTDLTRHQKNWINKVKTKLSEFPDSNEFWIISNVDGWSIGKGVPTMTSGTTYGSWGATGTLHDNFHDFYIDTVDVEYGEIDEDYREQIEAIELHSNRGHFKINEATTGF